MKRHLTPKVSGYDRIEVSLGTKRRELKYVYPQTV